mgnify:CR=1 FL=1
MPFLPKANFRFSTALSQPADDVTQTLYPNAVPSNVPTILVLDPKTDKEEKVKVTAKTSSSITVIRGYGGTTAKAHNLGASVVDYNNPEFINELVSAFEAEHDAGGIHASGITLPVDVIRAAAAQTLTNKTLGTGSKVALGSDAHGDIYYRNAAGEMTRLAPGLAGQLLKTMGVGANPEWTSGGGASLNIDGSGPQAQFTTTSGSLVDVTGVSVTTIGRVARYVAAGAGGYALAVKRLENL